MQPLDKTHFLTYQDINRFTNKYIATILKFSLHCCSDEWLYKGKTLSE